MNGLCSISLLPATGYEQPTLGDVAKLLAIVERAFPSLAGEIIG